MRVCIPVTTDGQVDHSWGRAARVAVAEIQDGSLISWEEFAVAWDRLHDETSEGGHHARVARFLRENRVETVAAGHMGQPMVQMLERMGIAVRVDVAGDAREAVATVAGAHRA
ncbi:MAG TPA: NifB/NifX family molybdenum-iron cluster-binding protein [Coriobacteriia bacterium]